MSVSGLHATRNRRSGRTARAIASAALAAALVSDAGAQTQGADPAESKAKTTEQPTEEGTRPRPPEAESKSAKPATRSTKPFTPTDRIDAESAVSFPANI